MAIIPKEAEYRRTITLAGRLREVEDKLKFYEQGKETKEKTKGFKWPWKWKRKFSQSHKKNKSESVLVIFLNKKNEIEVPKFMPIFDGNMVIWRNKPYEFDPRAIWTIRGVKKNPKVYLIKEIDRRPVRNKFGEIVYRDAAVSNMDLDEIRERGDSTESDEFLIKAALKAQTAQIKKKVNVILIVIIALIAIGGIIWYLASG